MDEEEGENELVSDNDSEESYDDELEGEEGEDEEEEIPELVKIDKNSKNINYEKKTVSSEVSDINVEYYGSSCDSSEYDSDELNIDSTKNPHGFVFSNMLETFSKTRRDRILEMRE